MVSQTRTAPIWRVVLQYLTVSLVCIIVGSVLDNPLWNELLKTDIVITVILLLISFSTYLIIYMSRYHAYNCSYSRATKPACISSFILLSVNILAILCFYVIGVIAQYYFILLLCCWVISLISTVYFCRLDENAIKRVRNELLWPSLFTISVSMYAGYCIKYFSTNNSAGNSLVPFFAYIGYLILFTIIFNYFKEDNEDTKQEQELVSGIDEKINNNDKVSWFHVISFGALCVYAFNDKNAEQLLLFVLAALHCSILEAWEVTVRQLSEKRKNYHIAVNALIVADFMLIPTFFGISDFQPVLLFLYLIVIALMSLHWKKKVKTFVNTRTNLKPKVIFFILSMAAVLFYNAEIDLFQQINHTVNGWLYFICNYYNEQIGYLMAGMSVITMVFSVVKYIIKLKKQLKIPTRQLFLSMTDLLLSKDNFDERKKLKMQTIRWSCFLALINVFLFVVFQNPNSVLALSCYLFFIIFVGGGGKVLKYINYIMNGRREQTPAPLNKICRDAERKSVFIKIRALGRMLHLPSALMLFVLVFSASIINTGQWLYSLLRPMPFVFSAMGAFALNDYYDFEKDKVNKPYRAIPSGIISLDFARKSGLTLIGAAFVLSLLIAGSYFETILYMIGCAGALCYSVFLHRISYIKSLVTALVTICPFAMIIMDYDYNINKLLFLSAVVLLIISKELLMDVFDIAGDGAVGFKTIAVALGRRVTEIISITVCLISLLLFAFSFDISVIGLLTVTLTALSAAISFTLWFTGRRHIKKRVLLSLWLPLIIICLPVLFGGIG